MRVETEGLGASELGLATVEVTDAAADLPDLVERRAGVDDVQVLELSAGAARLRLGAHPIAPQPEQLRTMHATQPRVEGRRLADRPVAPYLCPFRGALQVAELIARRDEAAVELAEDERPESSFGGEQHCLVEEREAVGGLAEADEDPSPTLERLGFDVCVPKAPADVERAPGLLERELECATPVRDLRLPFEQQSVLRCVGLPVEAALCPLQPAVGDCAAALEAEIVVESDRGPGGAASVAVRFELLVRDVAGGDAFVQFAHRPRRVGERLERRCVLLLSRPCHSRTPPKRDSVTDSRRP